MELELWLVKARIDVVKAKLWRHDLLQVLAVQRLRLEMRLNSQGGFHFRSRLQVTK